VAGPGERLAGSGPFGASGYGQVRAVVHDFTASARAGGLAAGNVENLNLFLEHSKSGNRLVSLAPRPVMLAGREALLADLHSRLAGAEEDGPRIVALHGLGGVGKTSVAVEYAHQHLTSLGVVWQFSAEDEAVLGAEFMRLAVMLGVAGVMLDRRDPLALVHSALADSAAPWLLVFDNAPDAKSLRPFLPPAGNGQVLITSQSALWPPGQGVEVQVLNVRAAAKFLTARTGDPDGQSARELAVLLSGLPLALEQAGAYIQATGGSLAGYAGLLGRRRADILSRGEPSGYAGTVATSLGLAVAQLEKTAPAAAGLLRLLACLASEPVPLGLLLASGDIRAKLDAGPCVQLRTLTGDPVAQSDAVAALRRYSLVTPDKGGHVSAHRLTQAVILDQLSADMARQWRNTAAVLVEAAIPADIRSPETWPACAVLFPHVQVALPHDSDGMTQIASYLGYSGDYPAARDLHQKIVLARERVHGSEHPSTLNARAGLARWTGVAGDRHAARASYAALLPVMERVLGQEHPDTLAAASDMARWSGRAGGNPAVTRDQYAALVPVLERVLGPEHPETLAARGNLAHWIGEAGDAATARDMLAELQTVMDRALGADHPDTLDGALVLALWTGYAGDPAAACGQYAALLPIADRVLGAEHPISLGTRASLASWSLAAADDPVAVHDQLAAILPSTERVFGPEHPSTLSVRSQLAVSAGMGGDPAAARDQITALLPLMERIYGPLDPLTFIWRSAAAAWTGQAGDPAAARDQLAAILPAIARALGAEHRYTLKTRAYLAEWTGEAGDSDAAREQYAALLPIMERILGPDDAETQAVRDEFARWAG
jgi:hypothetical protein